MLFIQMKAIHILRKVHLFPFDLVLEINDYELGSLTPEDAGNLEDFEFKSEDEGVEEEEEVEDEEEEEVEQVNDVNLRKKLLCQTGKLRMQDLAASFEHLKAR